MRFGYRRLTAMLLREGMAANHKRVYRLYREEGLAMRIRQRRRIRWNGAVTSPAATRANERWSMDFVSDCVSTGKPRFYSQLLQLTAHWGKAIGLEWTVRVVHSGRG